MFLLVVEEINFSKDKLFCRGQCQCLTTIACEILFVLEKCMEQHLLQNQILKRRLLIHLFYPKIIYTLFQPRRPLGMAKHFCSSRSISIKFLQSPNRNGLCRAHENN